MYSPMEWSVQKITAMKLFWNVHDELITETPDKPEFNAKELSKIMSTNPPWAKGLPLAAAGFEAYRYRKD